jgi:hypothetical protein
LDTSIPFSVAMAMKRISAHSPRRLACLILTFTCGFFINKFSPKIAAL